jgi:hypothetical protein
MSGKSRLPRRLPVGSKYVLEMIKGTTSARRYVELPGGRRVQLAARIIPSCGAGRRAVCATLAAAAEVLVQFSAVGSHVHIGR